MSSVPNRNNVPSSVRKLGAGEDLCHLTYVRGRKQMPPTQSGSPQGFASSLPGVNRLDLFPFCTELKIKLIPSKCPLASCLPSITGNDCGGIMTSASCVLIKMAWIYIFKFTVVFPYREPYSRLPPSLLSVFPIFQVKRYIEAPQKNFWEWLSLWLQDASDCPVVTQEWERLVSAKEPQQAFISFIFFPSGTVRTPLS